MDTVMSMQQPLSRDRASAWSTRLSGRVTLTDLLVLMVVVFGSFLLENDRTIKLFGTGLATAVFLDATIVRMLLVPATMELLGDRNWWLPRWLDRILPHIAVEGRPEPGDEPSGEPERELERV